MCSPDIVKERISVHRTESSASSPAVETLKASPQVRILYTYHIYFVKVCIAGAVRPISCVEMLRGEGYAADYRRHRHQWCRQGRSRSLSRRKPRIHALFGERLHRRGDNPERPDGRP